MNLIATIKDKLYCYIGQYERDEEWIKEQSGDAINDLSPVTYKEIIETYLKKDKGLRLWKFADDDVKTFFFSELKRTRIMNAYVPGQ